MRKLKFSTTVLNEIEALVSTSNISYLDAIIEYCEKNNLEIEYVTAAIKRNEAFKTKLYNDAKKYNLITGV